MRVLVTGLEGFVGGHLAEFLLEKKATVHGLSCDVLDGPGVFKIVKRVKPDRIFHLAAQSFVPVSWAKPWETLNVNIQGLWNVLEAVRRTELRPRIHVPSSSEVYGCVTPREILIRETNALKPVNPYGVSKAAQELLALQYARSFGMRVVVTRAFSHIGPRQRADFAASAFAKQIALIEAGKSRPVIEVGNLSAVRDFTDVRDVVRGYWLALEKGAVGEVYNVCSGRGRSLRWVLDFYLSRSRAKIRVQKDARRLRPLEAPVLVGDPSIFKRKTGWKPKLPLERTLTDILNYWRHEIGA